MTVEVAGARHRADRAGETFYFCGAGCRASFEANLDADHTATRR
jgi:Cu+-exporting ATPase